MKVRTLKNGDLELSLEPGEAEKVRDCLGDDSPPGSSAGESEFIEYFLRPLGYYEVQPEAVGALTSAPCISNSPDPEVGDEAWAFMGYQVTAFLEELLAGRPVIWQSGGKLEAKGPPAPDSVWAAVEAAGIKFAHHETDLYLPDIPEVRAILEKFPVNKANATKFKNQVEGGTWLDIPFAYLPAWEAKQKRHAT
jgi:hypothetical protein